MSATGYQHYENRYKKPRFERAFLEKVVLILRKQGVTDEDLADLGDFSEALAGSLAEVIEELRLLRQEVVALRQAHQKG
jgi:hypothetical protein